MKRLIPAAIAIVLLTSVQAAVAYENVSYNQVVYNGWMEPMADTDDLRRNPSSARQVAAAVQFSIKYCGFEATSDGREFVQSAYRSNPHEFNQMFSKIKAARHNRIGKMIRKSALCGLDASDLRPQSPPA
ncbi:MAG: hypothetical protein Q8Q62_15815 [Mesorhizobium sp.]|nr:hypothetical protein [Mesorhizobium sp.]